MTTPWERIEDGGYRSWLSATPISADEYNSASLLERRKLLTQYLAEQKQQQQQNQKQHEIRELKRQFEEMSRDMHEASEYILEQKKDSETLKISKPDTTKFIEVMARIGLVKDAPVWNDKPTDLPNAPPRFTWHESKEDSPQNRRAYMAYLRNNENLVLPEGTKIFDGSVDGGFLDVRMQGFRVKTRGNIDVPLASNRHQSLVTVRQNMLAAFEVKKDNDTSQALIDRQVSLQHLAASYLNPNTGLLTVMTDLNDRWHFYWFTKTKQLMQYEATASEAHFLIEHMLDEPETVSTPTDFLSRASWNEMFLASITESLEAVVPDDSHNNGGEDDDDEDDEEERHLSHQAGALSLSRSKGLGETRNNGGKRCAALDEEEVKLSSSPLDFMDEEEELQAFLHMAMQTSLHRMFGPPQAEAGNFPPSEIDC